MPSILPIPLQDSVPCLVTKIPIPPLATQKQDFYASPGDPLFYLHHAMLDRVWWIWQMQDPENRVNAMVTRDLSGIDGLIPQGGPGHKARTQRNLDDIVVDLDWTVPPARLVDLNEELGGLGGKFCHVYV